MSRANLPYRKRLRRERNIERLKRFVMAANQALKDSENMDTAIGSLIRAEMPRKLAQYKAELARLEEILKETA